jgi:hypothetical protein
MVLLISSLKLRYSEAANIDLHPSGLTTITNGICMFIFIVMNI